ncbi:Stp1/IreP family PP2C-type Ser/Thr phosphatase [Levilactobacillus tujiorum]|uniref:Stp1/IreP family PP2C-type Ser/Thr phosphatase n=1 Tax=Levilactobacillus tujiorum TaxID=2912243 RepID=A0ABX1L4N5_9LACO|nr:Stp1/IreP family PP2C-type Ser/Thr phosphatase [Levilactobacillus tujiorum]MCH5465024.1 Stp1/IreP family PP2C-type Ser/Thr phosphatase [Levilactobacillus tujiorum]NLR12025.1 Stp1/IreP family PP2C-type Ser/Thr phosphatase [Lactobacillus sp. HBUAS51387]NLR30000.1 Stp1/IreP family PP2C-type Ser/Thr phosphatase [Levilactobacillus tujiorum]NLR31306.1 Stp1/IreP family PP2C-type Ser/Thr phosphatase [Levilactobacillus tujiorum]
MKVAYRTSIGKQRQDNEDYVDVFTNLAGQHLAIIADGIGGHQGGDVASAMAVSHLGHEFEQTSLTTPAAARTWITGEITAENQSIIDKSNQFADLNGMGTTLVAALYFTDEVVIASIGDSRAYLLRDGHFRQLTEDHSLVNELVKRGEISKQAARHHPQKNVIIRSLGISSDAHFDLNTYPLVIGDQLLLCTDGLTNMVTDEDIQRVLLSKRTVNEKCDRLVEMANAAGGLDNITVLIIANLDGEVS